jgi:hypothetical protein
MEHAGDRQAAPPGHDGRGGICLRVEKDHVRSYLLHFRLSDVDSSNVQAVEYGNLYRGGLGFGKGLNYRALVKGKSRAYSIGEKFYGKEAIAHAKGVLESRLSKR